MKDNICKPGKLCRVVTTRLDLSIIIIADIPSDPDQIIITGPRINVVSLGSAHFSGLAVESWCRRRPARDDADRPIICQSRVLVELPISNSGILSSYSRHCEQWEDCSGGEPLLHLLYPCIRTCCLCIHLY